jgi:hypothetical protein
MFLAASTGLAMNALQNENIGDIYFSRLSLLKLPAGD